MHSGDACHGRRGTPIMPALIRWTRAVIHCQLALEDEVGGPTASYVAQNQGCSCRIRNPKLRVALIETGGSRAYVREARAAVAAASRWRPLGFKQVYAGLLTSWLAESRLGPPPPRSEYTIHPTANALAADRAAQAAQAMRKSRKRRIAGVAAALALCGVA
jgi:hypothetical protein